jgi:hypothetical protein
VSSAPHRRHDQAGNKVAPHREEHATGGMATATSAAWVRSLRVAKRGLSNVLFSLMAASGRTAANFFVLRIYQTG